MRLKKVLGSTLQHGGDMAADARDRVAMARQSWGPLVRSFFSKKSVTVETKGKIFKSLVMSRLMYNAHVWSWIRCQFVEKWANALRKMIAPIVVSKLHGVPSFHFTVAELCSLADVLDPMAQLHVNRLLYLRRMIQLAPSFAWACCWHNLAETAWLANARLSFEWLLLHCPLKLPLTMECSTQDWIQFVAVDDLWRKKVKMAASACLQHRKMNAAGKAWELMQLGKLRRIDCYEDPKVVDSLQLWICELCDKGFPNKRALAMRSSQMHSYVRRAKFFMIGSDCQVCLKCYHTRVRAIQHLEYSHRCFETYAACFGPLDDETVQALNDRQVEENARLKAQGWRPSKAFIPVTRLVGPALPPPQSEEASLMLQKWYERHTPGIGFLGLAGRCQPAVPPSDLCSHQEAESFVMNAYGGPLHGTLGCASQEGLAFLQAQVQTKAYFFIHFFSGYRRVGDLQHHIEYSFAEQDFQVYCVSVDICLCREQFDLTSHSAFQFWLSKAKDGYLIGAGGGPPCETVSAARFLSGGPGPVRNQQWFWGKPGNKRRCNRQVDVGNRLLQFMIAFLVEIIPLGLCGFLEHPSYPTWIGDLQPPSIWALKVVRALSHIACVGISTVDQCVFGAGALKPTTFLLIRLPGVQHAMLGKGFRGRCKHGPRAHRSLRGKDSDGFRTAQAKIYPAALNEILAQGILKFAAKLRGPNKVVADECPEDPVIHDKTKMGSTWGFYWPKLELFHPNLITGFLGFAWLFDAKRFKHIFPNVGLMVMNPHGRVRKKSSKETKSRNGVFKVCVYIQGGHWTQGTPWGTLRKLRVDWWSFIWTRELNKTTSFGSYLSGQII